MKTMKKSYRCATSALIAMTLAGVATTARAVEGGGVITPTGIYDFGAGILPPPSEYGTIGIRAAFTRSDNLRDGAGNASSTHADLSVNSYAVAFVKMTDIDLLGGKYGFSAVIPYLDMKLGLDIPTPVGNLALSGKDQNIGDVDITPIIVKWNPAPGWSTNASLQLQLPTGSYDKNRLINSGVNHWTFSPMFAFTYIMPSGFEISSNIQLNYNTTNNATAYRSGMEFEQDFALGQHIGPWTIGVGGYHYQQITNDVGTGVVDGNRSRVTALGPAINFFDLGSGLPVVFMHFYKEFDARNRTAGTQLAVRAGWSF